MTIYELSLSYGRTAADLRQRITALERASKDEKDEAVKHSLEGRIRPLRNMYRDTRAVARHLEHYYDKQSNKQDVGSGTRKGGRSDADGFL